MPRKPCFLGEDRHDDLAGEYLMEGGAGRAGALRRGPTRRVIAAEAVVHLLWGMVSKRRLHPWP